MKFNWGHGIVLVIISGVVGFLSLVFITTRERVDMVTEDYYPKELKYDDQIAKIKNYNSLNKKVKVELGDELSIQFPNDIADHDKISGLVHIYRPSDKDLDIEQEIKLNNNYQISIEKSVLRSGKYEVIIEWEANGQPYLTKEIIYID